MSFGVIFPFMKNFIWIFEMLAFIYNESYIRLEIIQKHNLRKSEYLKFET